MMPSENIGKTQTPIQAAMERLEKSIDRLEEVSQALAGRLASVAISLPLAERNAVPVAVPTGPRSQITSQVEGFEMHVSSIAARLGDLLERLET